MEPQKSAKDKKSRIVVIGGGTGVFTVLTGLRRYPVFLTAIVSMADDGGSAGLLREEFGMLPPGDVRRALIALARPDKRLLADLFNYRFREGSLRGHSFGNLVITALERLCKGDFECAINKAADLLGVEGSVVPVTTDPVRLRAELEDGTVVAGENNIDVPKHDGSLKIAKLWLEPRGRATAAARRAIAAADMIVIGPGDLYTSILPNLLVRGIPEAIRKAKGTKVYMVNVMTKWGETNGFAAEDFVRMLEQYLGKGVLDAVVVNKKRPSADRIRRYEQEGATVVLPRGVAKIPRVVYTDVLRPRGFIRHDPEKTARVLMRILRG